MQLKRLAFFTSVLPAVLAGIIPLDLTKLNTEGLAVGQPNRLPLVGGVPGGRGLIDLPINVLGSQDNAGGVGGVIGLPINVLGMQDNTGGGLDALINAPINVLGEQDNGRGGIRGGVGSLISAPINALGLQDNGGAIL
ncbi:hypothetical protein PM082_006689 [Marasmius tenuissimus]|nr:hypothetical protein PM082_006689 [Marasmius tenuissimus]